MEMYQKHIGYAINKIICGGFTVKQANMTQVKMKYVFNARKSVSK